MRTKGHNFERKIAKSFRELGYNTRTTRAASNLLDSCGVDIVGTPYIIQCKSGYARSRPKFEEEYRYIKQRLIDEFGSTHRVHQYPIIIIHELDAKKGRGHGRTSEDTYVMVTLNDFLALTAKAGEQDIIDIL